MKKILQTFAILLISNVSFSQNFYEIKWTAHDDVAYTALLVYYSQDDAYVRVKYRNQNGTYKVAQYKVKGKYITLGEERVFVLFGFDANVVYNNDGTGYSPDHFIYSNAIDGNYTELEIIDENHLSKPNAGEYFAKATSRELNPRTFTANYLYNFFDKNEPEYNEFLKYSQVDQPVLNNSLSTRLHLLIIANTLDNDIGKGCERDRDKIMTQFQNITRALNISLRTTVIDGNNFTKAAVANALNQLNPSDNDIVVFFYSGHGFRYNDQADGYPQMSLHLPYQPIESIALSDAYSRIIAKSARLNIILGDLCNSLLGRNEITSIPTSALKSSFYPDIEKLRRLFINSRGNLIASAATAGEVSYVDEYKGSYFTNSFFEALNREVGLNTGEGDWSSLLETTFSYSQNYTSNFCSTNPRCGQHGIKYVSLR